MTFNFNQVHAYFADDDLRNSVPFNVKQVIDSWNKRDEVPVGAMHNVKYLKNRLSEGLAKIERIDANLKKTTADILPSIWLLDEAIKTKDSSVVGDKLIAIMTKFQRYLDVVGGSFEKILEENKSLQVQLTLSVLANREMRMKEELVHSESVPTVQNISAILTTCPLLFIQS